MSSSAGTQVSGIDMELSRMLPRAIAAFIAVLILVRLRQLYPNTTRALVQSAQHGERRAYATFLSSGNSDNDDEYDPYFAATRVLAYQLLHSLETHTHLDIPFLVLVTPHVSKSKIRILEDEGATVICTKPVEPTVKWLNPLIERWMDQFSKLRLFDLTDYDRILYLDADVLLTKCLDGIWDEQVTQHTVRTRNDTALPPDEPMPPGSYLIVAVSDSGGPGHAFPPPQRNDDLNGGFFMLQPSKELFTYYEAIMNIPHRFDSAFMEQSLLNYVHRPEGPMPMQHFSAGKWNANWPGLQDLEGGAASLHDKFWDSGNKEWIDRELVEIWFRTQGRMEGFWQTRSGLLGSRRGKELIETE